MVTTIFTSPGNPVPSPLSILAGYSPISMTQLLLNTPALSKAGGSVSYIMLAGPPSVRSCLVSFLVLQ